jgi:hypothetical protein
VRDAASRQRAVPPGLPVRVGGHPVAADREEFDGFGGGITRRAKMRPAGQIHAIAESARSTLCGLALTQLLAFPGRAFESEPIPGKCPSCCDLVILSRRRAAGLQ